MARAIVRRRTPTPTYDGIHYDARLNPNAGGRCIVKVPGSGPRVGVLTDFFTFTGGNQSLYRGAAGLLVQSVTNTPRIEYDSGGNLLGLLIEGARTNLCLQSQDIATTWANNRSSKATNSTTAPDGTATADTLIEDNTNGQHYVTQNITIAASALTVSAFFKAKERSFAVLSINDGTTECVARYDLTAGTVGTVDATLSGVGSIVAYANGWYRCILRVTAANTAGVFRLAMTTTSSGYGYQGDAASGIYVWGAQVEQAAFPSSYIPTTTVGVARTVDSAKRTLASEFLSTAIGTWYVDGRAAPAFSGNQYLFGVDNDSADTNLTAMLLNSSGALRLWSNSGGSATALTTTGNTATASAAFKAAGVFNTDDFNTVLNGGTGATDTSGAVPTIAGPVLRLGSHRGSEDLFGHIRRLSYWPERKTNADLQRLTA